MKNDLLSIGEVAHLKGVGVKALRYYERIGILRPAYVNPDTGYRYYALRQMAELDVIVSCVQLGVPLKELTRYVSDRGVMDIAALLERARGLAVEKLRTTQAILMELDGYRSEIEVQKAFRTASAPYERSIDARTFLALPWSGTAFDAKRYTKAMTELYGEAKRSGLVPLFLQGMMCVRAGEGEEATKEGPRSWCVALEVQRLPEEEDAVSVSAPAPAPDSGAHLLELPARTYRGCRIECDTFEECYRTAFQEAGELSASEDALLAFEVWDAELRTDCTIVEVLKG